MRWRLGPAQRRLDACKRPEDKSSSGFDFTGRAAGIACRKRLNQMGKHSKKHDKKRELAKLDPVWREPAPLEGRSLQPTFRGDDPPLVFVNSSFRVGSTWFWQKLRGAPRAIAYNEPFNEALADLDFKKALGWDYGIWNSRHPESAPYWLEFLPLSGAAKGVEAYESAMAYERFIPAGGIDGDLSAPEAAYVERLASNAWRRGKTPVLCDTRTLGRARALSKRFPSVSILLHRNLFHQWASYCSQALSGNNYFLEATNAIIAASRHDPAIRMLDDWFASRTPAPADAAMFQCFLLLHCYLYGTAFKTADLTVNATAIADDLALREAIEAQLGRLFDAQFDLSDAKSVFGSSLVTVRAPRAFAESAEQFLKIVMGRESEDCAAFADAMLQDALTEWRRHEFYASGLRAHFVEQIAQARADAANRETECARAAETSAALEARLAEAASHRDEMARQIGQSAAAIQAAADQRDLATTRLTQAAAEAAAEAAVLQARIEQRESACESARGQVEAVSAELAELQSRLKIAEAERDAAQAAAAKAQEQAAAATAKEQAAAEAQEQAEAKRLQSEIDGLQTNPESSKLENNELPSDERATNDVSAREQLGNSHKSFSILQSIFRINNRGRIS